MEVANRYENDLNFKATELRLGLPGTEDEPEKQLFKSNKRSSPEINCSSYEADKESAAPPKAQVIGWPPVRSYRKNAIIQQKKSEELEGSGIFVKVSMDGAPYLRKIDLWLYKSYSELVKGLENMFKCNIGEYHEREGYNNGSNHHDHFTPTYEDKDGDWMLVGDVPWDMFLTSCKRMRIMKSSDANGIICS